MKPFFARHLLCLAMFFGLLLEVQAQHPVDVQTKLQQGEYMNALLSYDQLPRRRITSEASIAAAKSAWALSLPDRAISEFDLALKDEDLTPVERARILLSRGIIEFQEERFELAELYAEKMVTTLNSSGPLAANGYLLWAETQARRGSCATAEAKYKTALEQATDELKPGISLQLGECQIKLGQYEAARTTLETIPAEHELTPKAIRLLAEAALTNGDKKTAGAWLQKGRENYPSQFADSWVDFTLVEAAIDQNDVESVRKLQSGATTRFPPSDHWLNLINASIEEFEFKRLKFN